MKIALVVPTNRPHLIGAFLSAWQPWPWHWIILIVDQPEAPTFEIPDRVFVRCWTDLDRMDSDRWIFSRRDSAIRCFGFLEAARIGADVIFTLDDDCFPDQSPADFVQAHLDNLFATPAWSSSIPGLGVRGLPYGEDDVGRDRGVGVSMGLWKGVADLDAPRQLLRHPGYEKFEPPVGVRVMSGRQFFPLCGMNLAFRREILPALYFPLMGHDSPFQRFDDIWGGLTMQCAFAMTGNRVVVGEPFVRHDRASDPYQNLVREAPGIAAHPEIWRHLWPMLGSSTVPDLHSAMETIARHLTLLPNDTVAGRYAERWAAAIEVWLRLCRET